MSGIYPVGVEVVVGGRVSRWQALVNWLLALPLLLWLFLVSVGAVAAVVVAWFAIVLTGRMPGSLGDYLMGFLRYGWRVGAFLCGLTDRYPGFRVVAGYVDPGDQPTLFYSAQPLDRDRVTVLLRLVLLFPLLLFAYPVVLIEVGVLLVVWCRVLIVGTWPAKSRSDVVEGFRWLLRVAAYGWLIVDDYPFVNYRAPAEEPWGSLIVAPDPREVTGPPWPRLVGGETYQSPGLLRWPIVVGVAVFAFPIVPAAISGLSSGRPPATLATPPPATPATGKIIDDLEARTIPAPADYSAAPGFLWPNGITPAAYDQQFGAGSATNMTFLGGYEATYQSEANYDDFVDIQLFQFSSPQTASQALVWLLSLPPEEAPKQSAFSAIPGASALDGTKPFQGVYDHEVGATKGPLAMVLDYTDSNAGPAPMDLDVWADQEYRLL